VEKGFNSDVVVTGLNYHVQTEDWGSENPFLVSRVFKDGAVVKSIKTPYEAVLPKGPGSDGSAIRMAMRFQHDKILDLLVSGQLVPLSLK
jgi:hypothetical protein